MEFKNLDNEKSWNFHKNERRYNRLPPLISMSTPDGIIC